MWYDDCMYNGNPQHDCAWGRDNMLEQCRVAYDNAISQCDQAYETCVIANCGGSTYGGPPQSSCDPPGSGNGYSAIGVSFYGSLLDSCMQSGAEAFSGINLDPSLYNSCMTNVGDAAICCRGQIDMYIHWYCGCNIDPRNPDCKKCYSY